MKGCGLDVHKSRCWVHIRDGGGLVLETTITRDPGGLEALAKLYEKHEVEKVDISSKLLPLSSSV